MNRHRLIRAALPVIALPFFFASVGTQEGQPPAPTQATTPAPAPMINASDDPLLAPFRFRSIGPASMGGRIDDVEVAPSDPNIIYIGYAVGGVWKSENNGTTWDPVFDTYSSASIGDIAIHPTNPNIVYVGTGEANNRQTSSFGDGIYKTTDGGKTFQHIGLRETQTIARVVIDPRNPDTVYVAAPGHLFGPNPERGVYKTTDGGRTWNNVKFIDNDTGFTDIAIDPVEPEHPLRRQLPAPASSAAASTAADPAARCGRRPTPDARGRRSPARDCRAARTAASPSTSHARIPTSFTRRSRLARSASRRRPQRVDTAGATEATPTPPGVPQPPPVTPQAQAAAQTQAAQPQRGQRGTKPPTAPAQAQQAGGGRGGLRLVQ